MYAFGDKILSQKGFTPCPPWYFSIKTAKKQSKSARAGSLRSPRLKKLHFYVKFLKKHTKRQKNSCFYGVKQQKCLKKCVFLHPNRQNISCAKVSGAAFTNFVRECEGL